MKKDIIIDGILEIIKDESYKSDVRKYTCINDFGYSQFERNIANRVYNKYISKHSIYSFTELVAISLHKLGFQPIMTHFIDEHTIMYGYGKLNGNIGVWQYNLPLPYARKYFNTTY